MTSVPQLPGASAVYLFREEKTDDSQNSFSAYVRLKILSSKGFEFADVEVPYTKTMTGYKVDSIEGRTVHADGAIVPLTGKPYDKLLVKAGGVKVSAKVFTMPSVEVGSIIEYRYRLRADSTYFPSPPDWFVQSGLYTLKAHYSWKPKSPALRIAWYPILPVGVKVQHDPVGNLLELEVSDMAPAPDEEFMPPIENFSYRVVFYFMRIQETTESFWTSVGKSWSEGHDAFAGPGKAVKAAVAQLVAPSDTAEVKLHKLYNAIMHLENTDYTHDRSKKEDRAAGFKEIKTADDVWKRQRGSSDEINALFAGMVRAAGLSAQMMSVVDRDRGIFSRPLLTLRQLDDDITVVTVDGKDQFFDPGCRYCEFGHLAWKHTLATGLRQADNGSAVIAGTPGEAYTFSTYKRLGDLLLDEAGEVSGSIRIVMTGDPALEWRHLALVSDTTELNEQLKQYLQSMLPAGVEPRVEAIQGIDAYDKPFEVDYQISGPLGSRTGKRLLVPLVLLHANSKPTFTQDKRLTEVYFNYPYVSQEAVRIKYPEDWQLESVPGKMAAQFKQSVAYTLSVDSAPGSFTTRRNYTLGKIVIKIDDYPELRSFYSKFEAEDQEPVLLTRKSSADQPGSTSGTPNASPTSSSTK